MTRLLLRREVCSLIVGAPLALGVPRVVPAAGTFATQSRDVEVESFRQAHLTDREVLEKAFAAWDQRGQGNFVFGPGRTYDLGPLQREFPPFLLDGASGLSVIGNGAQILCETTAGIAPVFLIRRSRGVILSDLGIQDRGYRPDVDWKGAVLIFTDGDFGPSSDIELRKLSADGAVALAICAGASGQARVGRLLMTDLVANNCYYGVVFEENGDDVHCSLRARNCRRAYFCYGVQGHRADLLISGDSDGFGSDGCIVIARFERDTADIGITARFTGVLNWSSLVHFVQIPPPGVIGRMSDVSVDLDVDFLAMDRADGRDAVFTVYSKPGGEQVAESASEWSNVKATGRGIAGRQVVHTFETRPAGNPDAGREHQ